LVWLAALAIAVSGAIGFYHAGVELHYFKGFTQCTSTITGGSTDDFLKAIMNAPLVRCDDIQWSFLGISMAGWNAILSLAGALMILWLSLKRPRPA
jgi:disulfide bond formation protein DsbB